MKLFVLLFFLISFTNCSPVKFSTETTNPNACVGSACVSTTGAKSWVTGTWGTCSKACDTGTQSRSVRCVNSSNQTVADKYCSGNKPPTIQNCNTESCNGSTYNWNPGSWSDCSQSCGGGTQTRTVTCNNSTGIVGDSNCSGTKPSTSQSCNTSTCPGGLVSKTKTVTANSTANTVDILLVIDDSSSMAADNSKLASRMSGFVSQLQSANLNWQMCITTTDTGYYGGSPIYWSGLNTHILTKNSANLSTVFQQTIADIGSGFSNDEQGIKASVLNVVNNSVHQCYRTGASHAVIIISDEDERSVGGVYNLSGAQYQPLENQNLPATYIQTVTNAFGASHKFAVNGIVVKDSTCEAEQDAEGTPSFIGTKYMELVSSTNGSAGSICDGDYSTNLVYFKDAILDTVTEVTLDCTPSGAPTITFNPTGSITASTAGNKVTFSSALTAGTTVTINYQCSN